MRSDTNWLYGTYFGDYVVTTESRLRECANQLTILCAATRSKSWDDLFAEFPQPAVESALGQFLDEVWWAQDPEPDDARQAGELPPIEVVHSDSEAMSEAPDQINDAGKLAQVLPAEVMRLAARPDTSPMSGYDPCHWELDTLSKVSDIAVAHGVTLKLDQAAFDRLERLYEAIGG